MLEGASSFSQSLCWDLTNADNTGNMFDGTNGANNDCTSFTTEGCTVEASLLRSLDL